MKKEELDSIRTAVSDYMWSEGCSCCSDIDAHRQHQAILAKLLNVPAYPDGSGHDFTAFRTQK